MQLSKVFKCARLHELFTKVDEDKEHTYFHVGIDIDIDGKRTFEAYSSIDKYTNRYMQRNYDRCDHEYIRGHLPGCLFYDLDMEAKNGFSSEELTLVRFLGLIQKVVDATHTVLPILEKQVPIIWYCNRNGKFSAHVIFNYWFHQSCLIKTVVQRVASILPVEFVTRKFIDYNPYPTSLTSHHSLRLPYSNHHYLTNLPCVHVLRESPEIQIPNDICPQGRFNRDLFLRSLITVPPRNVDLIWHDVTLDQQVIILPPQQTGDVLNVAVQKSKIEAWLREKMNVKHFIRYEAEEANFSVTGEGRFKWHLTPGMHCPNKNERHNGNKSYIHVTYYDTESFFAWFGCTDCGFRWKTPTPISLIINPEVVAVSHKPNPF